MYKNIRYGHMFIGQTTTFKLRFSSIEDTLYKSLKAFTDWQDSYITEFKGKSYFNIVGAFHESHNERFKLLKDIALNDRDIAAAKNKSAILGQHLEELEEHEQTKLILQYQAKFMLDSF